jgi:hypothetical protein
MQTNKISLGPVMWTLGKKSFFIFSETKRYKKEVTWEGPKRTSRWDSSHPRIFTDETVDQSEEFEFDITTSENKFFHTMLTGGWAKSFTFPRKPKFGRHNYYWVTRLPQWSRDVSKSREITWSGSRNFTRVGSRDLKF